MGKSGEQGNEGDDGHMDDTSPNPGEAGAVGVRISPAVDKEEDRVRKDAERSNSITRRLV